MVDKFCEKSKVLFTKQGRTENKAVGQRRCRRMRTVCLFKLRLLQNPIETLCEGYPQILGNLRLARRKDSDSEVFCNESHSVISWCPDLGVYGILLVP